MSRDQVRDLTSKLHAAQERLTNDVLDLATFDSLTHRVPDSSFTVNDILRMWTWHFWSHHRDLVMAREVAQHVLETLETYFASQLRQAISKPSDAQP